MSVLEMNNIQKHFGDLEVLKDISLSVNKGEVLSIIGPSGSGKSTLLHVMGGVDTPNSGNVIVDGRDITTLSDEEMSVFRTGRNICQASCPVDSSRELP